MSLKLMDLRCLRHRFQILICIGLRSPSHQHTKNSRIIPNHRKKTDLESLIGQNGNDPYQDFFHFFIHLTSLNVLREFIKKKRFQVQNGLEKKQLRQSQTNSDGHKSQKHKCTLSLTAITTNEMQREICS